MISSAVLQQKFLKKGYLGNLPKTKEDLYNLYVKTYGPFEMDTWTKDQLVEQIHGLDPKKKIPSHGTKTDLQKIYTELYTKIKPPIKLMTPPKLPNAAILNLTISQLKEKVLDLGYKGVHPKLKQGWIDLYTELNKKVEPLPPPVKKSLEPPPPKVVVDAKVTTLTVAQLKEKVLALGYKGVYPKVKQGWVDLYNKLNIPDCQQIGNFNYDVVPLNYTKDKVMTKVKKGVGVIYTTCVNKICTFEMDDDASKYTEFTFVMKNDKGNYDAMEIDGSYVVSIEDLPKNMYNKLIGQCTMKHVPKKALDVIEKIEKKSATFCDNILTDYKIIPIDKDGNCFFQSVGNATNLTVKQVRQKMADQLTQKLVDIRQEFATTPKTLSDYKQELLTEDEYVNDYDVEQLFPLAFPKTGLIILNTTSTNTCTITCSSNLLQNKEKYIVLLFQRDSTKDKDNGAHYDLISIHSKLQIPFNELSKQLIDHIHKQCKTIHIQDKVLQPTEKEVELKNKSKCPDDSPKAKDGKHVCNEETGNWVVKSGKIGQHILKTIQTDNKAKPCPEDSPKAKDDKHVCNEETGNWVVKSGKIGQHILKTIANKKEIKVVEPPKKNVEIIKDKEKEVPKKNKKDVESVEEQPKKKEKEVEEPPTEKEVEKPKEKEVEEKELELTDIVKLNVDELVKLLKDKGYTGKIPKYKSKILELYKTQYYKEPINTDTKPTKPYDKMTIPELQAELKKINISNKLPRTKDELKKILNADRCNPINNEWCKDDQVCDLRYNVCLNKSDIKSTKNTKVIFDAVDEHPIAGTTADIFKVKTTLKKKIEPVSITIPKSIDDNIIQVKDLTELKQLLGTLSTQTSFNKILSQYL